MAEPYVVMGDIQFRLHPKWGWVRAGGYHATPEERARLDAWLRGDDDG